MWAQLNATLPPALRVHDVFSSGKMTRKDERLKEARINVERCNRALNRDRVDLDRKEKHLMDQIRQFAGKGDLVKARIAARQISHYRTASDRNYESAAIIQTRAQLMVSNHKINQAKVEALKGANYACMEDTIDTIMAREMKYAQMMNIQEEMERIMNEGMDDVYEDAEELIKRRDYFDLETEAILQEALDPSRGGGSSAHHYARTYTQPSDSQRGLKVLLHFRIYKPRGNFYAREGRVAAIDTSSGTLMGGAVGEAAATLRGGGGEGAGEEGEVKKGKGGIDMDFSKPTAGEVNTYYRAFPTAPTHHLGNGFSSDEDEEDDESVDNVGMAGGAASSVPAVSRGSEISSRSVPSPASGPPAQGSLRIATLCLSVSMLKHQMLRDTRLMTEQLKISKSSKQSMYDLVRGESSVPFRLGRLVRSEDGTVEEFEEFESVKSLKECGIADGGIIYVVVG
ncbi:hypothetical protein BC830DRAFT_1092128 [Chytriomyces sp. MP71]|nr:hypothetical protein BC830DRAFT_1092128 [Chytriomyces sp. MP71]